MRQFLLETVIYFRRDFARERSREAVRFSRFFQAVRIFAEVNAPAGFFTACVERDLTLRRAEHADQFVFREMLSASGTTADGELTGCLCLHGITALLTVM